MAGLGAIALSEALRRVQEQQATLAQTRAASGAILTANAVGSGVLASVALRGDNPNVGGWAWAAIAATAVATVLSLLPLLPVSLGVATKPELLDQPEWRAHDDDAAAFHLARYIWTRTESNDKKLNVWWSFVVVAGGATSTGLLCWIAAVAARP